ncbi:MAG: translocation/assembly module TamB domain-containing protein [Candidatus Krumholzibacteriota bacterium]
MRLVRPQKLPLMVAWVVIAGVIYWLGSHPNLVAPYGSNLVSRHLLRIEGGGLRVRDFRVRAFEGLDLYGVSLTLPGKSGGMTLMSADTVTVDFKLQEALGAVPHLRRVVVTSPEIYSMAGNDTTSGDDSGTIDLKLPSLLIEHLVVRDAFLEFSDSGGRLEQRLPDIDFRGRVRTGNEVRAVLRGLDADWETHESRLTGIRGEVTVGPEGIEVAGLGGFLNEHPVKVDGGRRWDGDLDIAVTGRGVSVAEVESLIDQTLGFNAAGDIEGTFRKEGDLVFYEGEFGGELEGYQVQDLTGRATISSAEVLLEDMEGIINEAGFQGGGRFDISNDLSVTFALEGDVWDVDLAEGLVPGEGEMPRTDGVGRLRIEHSDYPEWTRVSGVLNDGFIEFMPFDTCYVEVVATGDSVFFNRVEIMYGNLHGMLEGAADTADNFDGYVSVNSENINALPPDWNWPPTTGRLNGQGAVAGPLDALVFEGWVNLYQFGFGALGAGSGEVALVVEDLLGAQIITAGVDGRDFSIGGVPFGDFSLWGSAGPTSARVDSFRTDLGDTNIFLRFRADYADSVSELQVDEFQVDLEGTLWAIDEPVDFSVGGGHFWLPGMRLSSDQGALVVNGLYEKDQVVAGSLQLESFDLALLNPFIRTEHELAGRMTADVVVGGEPASPQVNLTADLVDAPFTLADVHSMHVIAGFNEGAVDFEELDLRSNFGRVTGKGTVSNPGAGFDEYWAGSALDLDLTIHEGDWAFLDQFALPALDRLAGLFEGDLQVAGSVRDPLITGKVHSAPFNIHWLHLDELASDIQVDSRSMVLGDMAGHKNDLTLTGRIEIPLVLDLISEPTSPPDGPFFMQLDIPWGSNLAPLAQATNAFITASGTGGAHVVVSGPLEHPLYQGTVEIDNGGFVLRNLQEVYHKVSAEGILRGDELKVFNIRGKEGLRGSFTGEGQVLFRGLEMESFDIQLDLDRFLVASIPDLAVVVSGRGGRLTSVPVGPDSTLVPKFSGRLEVMKARYVGNFSENNGGNDPLQATVAPDWLADLRLHAQPRVATIINRELELYMGGDLDLIRTEGGLYLRGSLDVNSGRLIVFNNNFEVQRGRLDFSRELGFDPRVDLDAETKYRLRSQHSSNSIIEVIGVHVSGPLSGPDIQFSSDRGYSREAIQRMLLGLEPHATPEGDSGRLANTSIAAGFNIIEREIARELDIFDTFEIDQIQRQRETGDTGLDPLIGVGKYIGSDLYLKYAQGIRQDDRDFIVEYQINQHLLLQSEIRRRIDENQGESTYNLDLKYRFEY